MDLLRFATAGSVDDGKSTLIGRLLYDSKSIFADQLEAVEATSVSKGHDYVDLSLLTGESHTPAVLIGTLGVWCVLTLTLHLRNQSGPDERLYALTAAFTATALTVVAAGYLASLDVASADAVTVGTGAVAAAALVRTLPLPPFVSPAVALLAAEHVRHDIALQLTCERLTAAGLEDFWATDPQLEALRDASAAAMAATVHDQ